VGLVRRGGHFANGTIYATFDVHTFGDMRPYAYKSTDFGATWTLLVAPDSPVRGYAHVIKKIQSTAICCTWGPSWSVGLGDGGKQWAHYKGGDLPAVAVRDLAIHPRDHDLVIATHGRGIWIVDDISPLRALTPKSSPVRSRFWRAVRRRSACKRRWVGERRCRVCRSESASDAVITYYQRRRHIFGDMKLEVYDASGKLLGTMPTSKRRGLNRVTWSMRLAPRACLRGERRIRPAYGARVLRGPTRSR